MEDIVKKEVRQHNLITTARHEFSAVQLDIYFMVLSLIRKGDTAGITYEITVQEIESITGRNWNYQQLREATEGLIGKVFEINEADGLLQVALMSSAKYLRGQGKIQITISDKIIPYLVDLKRNFTSFQLFCVLSMKSKYAKWLYLQFSRWKDKGRISFEIDELKYLLKLKDPKGKESEQYKSWSTFKEKVIDIAVKQINDKSDLHIQYSVTKKGKKINRISFEITIKEIMDKIVEINENDDISIKLIERIKEIGIYDNAVIKKVIENSELRERAFKLLYEIKVKGDNIKNPAGFFRNALGI
ncbi:replication initiator protein [Dyadobacter jejuensis]|uniref:Replication initiator protein n=1 Tax=Dyadobacter jejuensis TaxID=1082580 RepID=A0A316A7K3_9BACT|nr:replication initiation protein [Dyadobacter jejuensis]PWJ53429.1 replication initiator protein [Dyadobacter jejuensis]